MSDRTTASASIHERMLIGGRLLDGSDRLEVRNPARPGEVVGTIVRGTPQHVHEAIAAAKAVQPAWAALTFAARAELLDKALTRLEDDIEPRAVLYVRENGKPLAEARGELAGARKRQQVGLAYAAQLDVGRTLQAAHGRTLVSYLPYGVVVSIVPWNAPVTLGFTQVVAALLAGNAVVLKPPETCPLALMRSVALFAEHLPAGVINVVTGLPSEIGDALTTHPDVGKIGFTGSIASARHIMANAAQTIKDVTLELGGNDPAVVLQDADFSEAAMREMVGAVFQMAGQVCMAIKRIYVPTARFDEFMDAFCKAAASIVVGDGLAPGVTMGPLHTQRALQRAQGLLDDAIDRGGRTTSVGRIDDEATFATGHFMRPAVVTGLPEDAPLMAEEQFCPCIPVSSYDDLDDAIRRANRTIFGLSGSIWGRDIDRALAVARRIEAGQVWINAHGVHAINHSAPYGGIKQSGIGRKSGLEGILEYVQSQTIITHEH